MEGNAPDRMLRRPEVIAMTGLSTSTIYQRMTKGTFPKAVRLGVRAVGWPEAEIRAWLAQCERYGE